MGTRIVMAISLFWCAVIVGGTVGCIGGDFRIGLGIGVISFYGFHRMLKYLGSDIFSDLDWRY